MGNSRTISWHHHCVLNHAHSLAEMEARVAYLQKKVQHSKDELDFYRRQIDEAKKRGLTEFDRDRFMHKRAKKVK
jgi:hypothetical protein